MKNLVFILLFIIGIPFLSVLTSCGHSTKASKAMDEAESFIDNKPDTSLKILSSIDKDKLGNDEEKARYALLFVQSMDKNHLDPTDDSLISVAVDFYRQGDDHLHQAMSIYYQGIVRYHLGNYPLAIVSFFEAKGISEKHGFNFWAGMASRGISDIYNETYNVAEELSFAKDEYRYIKKSGKQPYINYALLDLCRATHNYGNKLKSDSISRQLLDSAQKYEDPYLYKEALQFHIDNLIDDEKYEQAYPLLLEVCKSNLANATDSLNLSNILIEIGNVSEAINILNKTSDENAPLRAFINYKISKRTHNYESALKDAEYIDSVTNYRFRNSASHNLTSSLTEYFELNKKLDNMKIEAYHIKIWAVSSCSLLLLILLLSTGFYIRKRNKQKISEKIYFAEQLQNDLIRAREENSRSSEFIRILMSEKDNLEEQIQKDLIKIEQENCKHSEIIQNLISSKYKLLEELSSIIAEQSKNTKNAEKKIVETVTKLIHDLSTRSDKIDELEKQVDYMFDNLMTDFKEDLPGLKDVDYRLYLFSVLRLPTIAISLFLKEDKALAVYNRKKRLKDKIKQFDDKKRERYLKFIS